MIIKIVCAGFNNFKNLYQENEDEMLVGVDGGINEIIQLGKRVNLGVGDFDSSKIEEVVLHCDKIRVFPKDKDYGDLELAILEVINLNFDKIIVYNATGGRLDHYQAVLNVLIKYSSYNIEIVDEKNRIRVIDKPTVVQKSNFDYVSLFAIDEGVRVTLTGFKYPLENYLLTKYDNLCLSNEILTDEANIEINNRRVLLIESK